MALKGLRVRGKRIVSSVIKKNLAAATISMDKMDNVWKRMMTTF